MRNERVIAYDTLIMVTPQDYVRMKRLYPKLKQFLPGELVFIGNCEVGRSVNTDAKGQYAWLDEEKIISFDAVHSLMAARLADLLKGRTLPRGVTGWYYQQFLKMQYSRICDHEYYMVWDGDTVPCRPVQMFQEETGIPYFDLKTELHQGYFDTIAKILPGMKKVISRSFISEHMLIRADIMREMLNEIEENEDLPGRFFWEKILYAIPAERIQEADFSEFETFGTYASVRHMGEYVLRAWHSFRLGGEFFDITTISDRDFEWLGKDFDAISFEKGHFVREDHKNLFDNPVYQNKLSARIMLESIQDLFNGGYIEVWDDQNKNDDMKINNDVHIYEGNRFHYISDKVSDLYMKYGERLEEKNLNQAYLCYENAKFFSTDDKKNEYLIQKMKGLVTRGASVRKAVIVIVSYNNQYLLQKCLESIYENCCEDTYRVVIFDNASEDGTREWLKQLKEEKIQIIFSEKNLGFAAGCNKAAQMVLDNEDIFFLNNDTRLPANALFWLRFGLYENDQNGAIGSMQNYSSPDQRDDVTFDLPEQYMEYGAQNNTPERYYLEEKPKLSGFALLMHADVFFRIGGFDEKFGLGYFEDDDLCFRVREQGYHLYVCHNSFIYHAGSQAFSKRKDLEILFGHNRKYFCEKWGFDSVDQANLTDEEIQMIRQIALEGYKKEDVFDMVYYGAGCGNALSRVKYLYPNARLVGVENNEVVRKHAIGGVEIIGAEDAKKLDLSRYDIVAVRDKKKAVDEQITIDFCE